MNLVPITRRNDRFDILFRLLNEKTPEQAISHKEMPTAKEHERFVNSNPYLVWYFIEHQREIYGAMYLGRDREIGITIFNKHQGKGYGKLAVEMIMEKHPGKFLVNINPENKRSIKFFEQFGFKLIQNTYVHSS